MMLGYPSARTKTANDVILWSLKCQIWLSKTVL